MKRKAVKEKVGRQTLVKQQLGRATKTSLQNFWFSASLVRGICGGRCEGRIGETTDYQDQ